jgi:hypothetical protein
MTQQTDTKILTDGTAWFIHQAGFTWYILNKLDWTPLQLKPNPHCWLCRALEPHSQWLHEHLIFDDVSDDDCVALYATNDKKWSDYR